MELKKISAFVIVIAKKILFYGLLTVFLFFFLYALKSVLGIDIFQDFTIEDLPQFILFLLGPDR
ncbi:MAG TPA: hypothetical protein PK926_07160 [Spirochaetota bacterium]|nr:hypothetical protein [Spirochaetota bacterium]HPI90400.1 hypothetical protein [Spirochaetota bacterium]HPR48517.1 hypothetical protein [Spirochaetota bacterium]